MSKLKTILATLSILFFASSIHAAKIAVTVGDGSLQPGTTTGFNVSSGTVVTLNATRLITRAPKIDVKSYGAKGDGTTNDRTSIQAAFTAVATAGVPRKIVIPEGTFKINSQIQFDPTVTSVECIGSILDFSSMSSSTQAVQAITGSRSYSGEPYYNAVNSWEGCTLIGPASTGTNSGFFLGSGNPSAAHYVFRDNVLYNFNTAFLISSNTYLVDFLHNNTFAVGTCYKMEDSTNAGERILIADGACFNSDNGVRVTNANADVFIRNMSIDGISNTYIYHSGGGGVIVQGSHFEGNFAPDYPTAQIYLSTGPTRNMAVFDSCWFLIKSTHSKPAFQLEGLANQFRMTNCYINGTASISSATIRANTVGGKVSIFGTFSTMNDSFFENISTINYVNINDQSNAATFGQEMRIKGVSTSNTAATGDVGENTSAVITRASPTSAAASDTLADLTNRILTPGSWKVWGAVCGSTNSVNGALTAGIGDSSGTGSSGFTLGTTAFTVPTSSSTETCVTIPPQTVSTSISVTKFLKFYFTYSGGLPKAYGYIEAERTQR